MTTKHALWSLINEPNYVITNFCSDSSLSATVMNHDRQSIGYYNNVVYNLFTKAKQLT